MGYGEEFDELFEDLVLIGLEEVTPFVLEDYEGNQGDEASEKLVHKLRG